MKHVIVLCVGLVLGLGVGYMLFRDMPQGTHTMMNMDTEGVSEEMQTLPHENMAGHTHAMIEVDGTLPVPGVKMTLIPDSKDGYNLKLSVTNFTFTPEVAGGISVPNQGHAHLYINDVKVSRIYGEWFYVSSSLLKDGENTLMVTLNANDHSDWVYQGGHIGDVALVTK